LSAAQTRGASGLRSSSITRVQMGIRDVQHRHPHPTPLFRCRQRIRLWLIEPPRQVQGRWWWKRTQAQEVLAEHLAIVPTHIRVRHDLSDHGPQSTTAVGGGAGRGVLEQLAGGDGELGSQRGVGHGYEFGDLQSGLAGTAGVARVERGVPDRFELGEGMGEYLRGRGFGGKRQGIMGVVLHMWGQSVSNNGVMKSMTLGTVSGSVSVKGYVLPWSECQYNSPYMQQRKVLTEIGSLMMG
jgi:hypothetical protein